MDGLWRVMSLTMKGGLIHSSQSDESQYHYEMGKTINGLAAVEVMSGAGSTDWEKAMMLFQDSEHNYLHQYRRFAQMNDEGVTNWENIPQEMVEEMTPHLVQLVIDVRSSMGEVLRQQGRHWEAVEVLHKALDLARMDVTRMNANEHQVNNDELDSMPNDPTLEARRNAVVDLMVKIADSHIADENYNYAASSYEKALVLHSRHLFARCDSQADWSGE